MVKRSMLHGEPIIILEEKGDGAERCMIWIPEAVFQVIREKVKEDLDKGTIVNSITRKRVKNVLGYSKYRDGLQSLGFDV